MIDYQRKQSIGFYEYYSYLTDNTHGMLSFYDANLRIQFDSRTKRWFPRIPDNKQGTSLFIDERFTGHNIG